MMDFVKEDVDLGSGARNGLTKEMSGRAAYP
jgi:hypothetical protein